MPYVWQTSRVSSSTDHESYRQFQTVSVDDVELASQIRKRMRLYESGGAYVEGHQSDK